MSLARSAPFSPVQWARAIHRSPKSSSQIINRSATRLRSKTEIAESHSEPTSLELDIDLAKESEDHAGQGFSTSEIESLVEVLSESKTVSEVKLTLDGSSISMRRKGGSVAPQPAAVAADPATASQSNSGSVTGSLEESLLDSESSMDEGLIYVLSPKVGLLRKALYNKAGKKVGNGPKVGAAVKKGQALCSIEQLGTYVPVLAPQPGEIVGFEIEDGDPVEYNQEVLEFAPYFGGHIIGDSKYS